MAQVLDSLDTARQAAGRHAWRAAYDAYTGAPAEDLTAADLESFAEAAWWTGKLDQAISLRERSFAAYSAADEKLAAVRMALNLYWDHLGHGSFAISHGWFANAERLLNALPESSEHGHLTLSRAFAALLGEGSLDEALTDFERAFEMAERFGDRDTRALALVGRGRTLVQKGEVEQGLALLDEASTAAVCGELRPFATGLVHCITITSCQDVGDFRRAAEWTEAANRWCDRLDVTGFPGACRVHRAEIMRLRGDWPAAERQAQAACDELQDFDRHLTGAGHYEIGEIRRRRGDFAAAEEAYRTANEWGRDPQPGLSLLRLAEGKVDAASAAIAHALREVNEPLPRVRLLPAQVEIALATGDLKTARAAAAELEGIVDSYKLGAKRAPAFDAWVHLSFGQIQLAEKDWEGAAASLRRARDEWQKVGAPYETAQARMLLGLAYRRQGDEHVSAGELEAALAVFERLGARLEEERVKELLGRVEARRTFLFTDIVDSTKLLETLGVDKWKRLLTRHDELIRSRIVETGGEVIKHTGDGFFASFPNPKAALEAAVGIQRALAGEIVAPDVRIGTHSGGAFHTDAEASDYGGQGVHVAARIGAAAGAGEILASRDTLDGIGASFRSSDPRTEALKGLEQPIEVVSIDWR